MAIYEKKTGVNTPVHYTSPTQRVVPITTAAYQLLSNDEKNNGTIYNVDGVLYQFSQKVGNAASGIVYDNTTSGRPETDVQSAIDGISSDLSEFGYDTFKSDLSLPYTATDNCILEISFKCSSAGACIFKINGSDVYNYSQDGESFESVCIPMKKGDILTYSGTSIVANCLWYSHFKLPTVG